MSNDCGDEFKSGIIHRGDLSFSDTSEEGCYQYCPTIPEG